MWSSMTLLQRNARDVIHVHPLGSSQHTAVPAEPRASRLSHPSGRGRYSHPYADTEAKNPWSGLVTGP